MVDLFRGIFRDETGALEARAALMESERRAAAAATAIEDRLLVDRAKGGAKGTPRSPGVQQALADVPSADVIDFGEGSKDAATASASTVPDAVATQSAAKTTAHEPEPGVGSGEKESSSKANAGVDATADDVDSSAAVTAVVSANPQQQPVRPCDQLAQAVFAALDLDGTGTVPFHAALRSWFGRVQACFSRVDELENECEQAVEAVRREGDLGMRDAIAELRRGLAQAVSAVEERCDDTDARTRMADAKARGARTQAMLKCVAQHSISGSPQHQHHPQPNRHHRQPSCCP